MKPETFSVYVEVLRMRQGFLVTNQEVSVKVDLSSILEGGDITKHSRIGDKGVLILPKQKAERLGLTTLGEHKAYQDTQFWKPQEGDFVEGVYLGKASFEGPHGHYIGVLLLSLGSGVLRLTGKDLLLGIREHKTGSHIRVRFKGTRALHRGDRVFHIKKYTITSRSAPEGWDTPS